MNPDQQIIKIEEKLAEYGKIPSETWISERNDVVDRVEWIIRRLKMTEKTLFRYKEALEEIESLEVGGSNVGILAKEFAHRCLWKI